MQADRKKSTPEALVQISSLDKLRCAAQRAAQDHLFADWDQLNDSEQNELIADLQTLDFEALNKAFTRTVQATNIRDKTIRPTKDVAQLKNISQERRNHWRSLGYDLISLNKVAVLILAGGQGTRLGSNQPKGCYKVGLPSEKSLFQLHLERIKSIQQLAQRKTSNEATCLHVYIMTSVHTHQETEAFLQKHAYFGLSASSVHLFQQELMPCFTTAGKIIMETRSKIALSPNGNGGVFSAMEISGCLADMAVRAKPVDPVFIGYCSELQAPCGARVVAKAYPEEKVGVFANCDDRVEVIEYSELTSELANLRDPQTNELQFNWSNICMHYFSTAFLQRLSSKIPLSYHTAQKKIISCGRDVQGIKLERFIFDVFPLANSIALMEVAREEEYSPVKNAPGCSIDSPDTARDLLMKLHRKWIRNAGGIIPDTVPVEISPLVSYEGENMVTLCQGKDFTSYEFVYLDSVLS